MLQSLSQTAADIPSRKQEILSHVLGTNRQVDVLRRNIVRCRLHIKRCRFVTRFELADLGITVEDDTVRQTLEELTMLGEKRLLPEEYAKKLNQVEGGARYYLRERAFRTEMGAFVPYTNYQACKAQMEEYKRQYYALRDEIVRNYQPIKRQTLSRYDVLARDAYQRIRLSRPDLLSEPVEAFVASYCNRIGAQIPTPERIRATFSFKFLPYDELLQFSVAQQQVQEQTATPLADVEASRLAVQQEEAQREAIERDLRLQAQERLGMLDELCTALVSQLRSRTYDAVCDVLATLQRRSAESFAPQSVTQLKNLIERIKGLNFYGDTDIDAIMGQLHEIVHLSPEGRKHSLVQIQNTLRAIATTCRATLLDLDEEPRSARELAIPDFPSGHAVRQARSSLGLSLDPALFAGLSGGRVERSSSLPVGSLWGDIDFGEAGTLERLAR